MYLGASYVIAHTKKCVDFQKQLLCVCKIEWSTFRTCDTPPSYVNIEVVSLSAITLTVVSKFNEI